jgi:hypothetical protein
MRIKNMRNRILAALAFLLSSVPCVGAETTVCTGKVTAVPFTISASGNYCFDRNLTTAPTATTNAITINADYVTLDLNGFKLDGSPAPPGARRGIFATNRKGLVVRNGVVRGFARGVSLEGTGSSHLVEDLRAEGHTQAGIWAEGSGIVVRGCKVSSTLPLTPDTSSVGIYVLGSQARLLHNDVLDTLATGSGLARSIVLEGGASSVVESNRVSNAVLASGSTGIVIASAQDLLLSANTFSTLDYGLVFEVESYGKFRDNTTAGVNTPYTGGSDVGGNQ